MSVPTPLYKTGQTVNTPEGWSGTVMNYELVENEWEYFVANRPSRKAGYFLEHELSIA